MTEIAPPIGLMPKKIHQEHRMMDICAAMLRYIEVGLPVPEEWIEELSELAGSQKIHAL